jgi:hypothetical protein
MTPAGSGLRCSTCTGSPPEAMRRLQPAHDPTPACPPTTGADTGARMTTPALHGDTDTANYPVLCSRTVNAIVASRRTSAMRPQARTHKSMISCGRLRLTAAVSANRQSPLFPRHHGRSGERGLWRERQRRRRAVCWRRAWSARASNSTISTSTRPPPAWCSASCSSPGVAAAQQLLSFATIGVAFVARPLGSIFFGHFGDRIGRKSTLVASLLTMGISTTLVAFLPTYASAGWIAALAAVRAALRPGLRAGRRMGRGGLARGRECAAGLARALRHVPAIGRAGRVHRRQRPVPDARRG